MTVFRSEHHKHTTLDQFERQVIKIIREAAIYFLRFRGYTVRTSRQGEIVVTKSYGRGQRWEHRFTLDVYANHL